MGSGTGKKSTGLRTKQEGNNEAEVEIQTKGRQATRKERGIFEKHVGSNIWWIRFVDGDGRGSTRQNRTWSQAYDLLKLRRADALRGIKLPEMRRRAVSFQELADDAIAYIDGCETGPA